jgi:hypothetical protein
MTNQGVEGHSATFPIGPTNEISPSGFFSQAPNYEVRVFGRALTFPLEFGDPQLS